MKETGRTSRRIHFAATWTLAIGLASTLVIPFVAGSSVAKTAAATELSSEDAELAKKAEWQDRYRTLRNNAARMRDNAIKLRRAYGLSQHANYPRGGARLQFKEQVLDTERKADDYAAQVAAFADEARQHQIPPGWIYEVDDEPVDLGTPAAADDDESTHEIKAPDGRNPLYFDNDDNDDNDDDESDESDEDEEDSEDPYEAEDSEDSDEDD